MSTMLLTIGKADNKNKRSQGEEWIHGAELKCGEEQVILP